MKNFVAALAILACLMLAPTDAPAASTQSFAPRARSASLYPIPPAPPNTPAAAAHTSASDVASDLADTTPGALGAKGSVRLHAVASGPGTIAIVLSVTIAGRDVVIGSGRARADAAGAIAVTVKLTHAGKVALTVHEHLKVAITVVFHVRHGAKKTASLEVALK